MYMYIYIYIYIYYHVLYIVCVCFWVFFWVFFSSSSNLYLYNTVLSVLFCVNKDIIIYSGKLQRVPCMVHGAFHLLQLSTLISIIYSYIKNYGGINKVLIRSYIIIYSFEKLIIDTCVENRYNLV